MKSAASSWPETLASPRPELTTERLRLRAPGEQDSAAIAAIVGDWEVARRLGRVPHPYNEADARFFLENVAPRELVWAITLRESGAMIGMMGLKPEPTPGEIGYYLGQPYWGRGYATEAGRAVVAHAFERLGLPHLLSGYFADNPASGRVLAKLGFLPTGPGRRFCLAQDREVPSIEMRLARA